VLCNVWACYATSDTCLLLATSNAVCSSLPFSHLSLSPVLLPPYFLTPARPGWQAHAFSRSGGESCYSLSPHVPRRRFRVARVIWLGTANLQNRVSYSTKTIDSSTFAPGDGRRQTIPSRCPAWQWSYVASLCTPQPKPRDVLQKTRIRESRA